MREKVILRQLLTKIDTSKCHLSTNCREKSDYFGWANQSNYQYKDTQCDVLQGQFDLLLLVRGGHGETNAIIHLGMLGKKQQFHESPC